jgi:thymidylate kinase
VGAAKGLIVEGIPGTGKSTLIRTIQRQERFLKRDTITCLIFGEEMTQRTLEKRMHKGNLSAEDHFQLFDELLALLERQQERFAGRGWTGEKDSKHIYYLLERFHLTHATYYPYLREADFSAVEERLLRLGARGCLLVMERHVMRERIIESRPFPAWRSYIARYGDNEDAIVEHYWRQQEQMLAKAERSPLPWLVLDTTNANWVELAPRLLSHWF